MPGPAIHHLIAEQLKKNILSGTGLGAADYSKLQALLSNPASDLYFYLGCQGPVFFFF